MRDSDLRRAVRQRLANQHARDDETRIVEEMGVWSGSVRIDLAVINGKLTGYELKSDRDTLERLPTQADLYSRVFDRMILVVGKRHSQKAATLIPDWWGILKADARSHGIALSHMRRAKRNPHPEPYLVAQLLWKDEALAILDSLGISRGFRGRRVRALHERLVAEVPFKDLATHVRTALKRRVDWLGQS